MLEKLIKNFQKQMLLSINQNYGYWPPENHIIRAVMLLGYGTNSMMDYIHELITATLPEYSDVIHSSIEPRFVHAAGAA